MARNKFSPEALNYKLWPSVDETILGDEQLEKYRKLKDAIAATCDGKKMAEIEKMYGIRRSLIQYYLGQCTKVNSDGSLAGFRALVSGGSPRAKYTRTAQVNESTERVGYAGVFTQLLENYPKTEMWLEKNLNDIRRSNLPTAGIDKAGLHQKFLRKLRSEGCPPSAYPFTTRRHGYEAFSKYLNKLIEEGDTQLAVAHFGETASQAPNRNSGFQPIFSPIMSFQKVAYDEYELPNIATISIKFDDADVVVPLSRGYFCPIVDFKSIAVLGFSFSLRKFDSKNLLSAFEYAITPPETTRHEAFRDLPQILDQGFPAKMIPEAVGRRISNLCLDNHLSHLASSVVGTLRNETGISITFGKVHSWIERNVVEGIFAELQKKLVRIASTTGSGISDPKRKNPVKQSVNFHISMHDLISLIEEIVARRNVQIRRALMGVTPNEVVAADFRVGNRFDIVPKYSDEFVKSPNFADEVKYVTIRGSREENRVPYVQLDEVSYTNDILRQSWGMIGEKLLIRIKGDYRTVRAFRPDGTEFGVLSVSGRWARTPHSVETRREINKIYRDGVYKARSDDPVTEMQNWWAENAAKKNRKKANPKITKSANSLAESLHSREPLGGKLPAEFKVANSARPEENTIKSSNRRSFFSPKKD